MFDSATLIECLIIGGGMLTVFYMCLEVWAFLKLMEFQEDERRRNDGPCD